MKAADTKFTTYFRWEGSKREVARAVLEEIEGLAAAGLDEDEDIEDVRGGPGGSEFVFHLTLAQAVKLGFTQADFDEIVQAWLNERSGQPGEPTLAEVQAELDRLGAGATVTGLVEF